MTDEAIATARTDIEATGDLLERALRRRLPMREPIVISWEEWKVSRAAKRENLRRLRLDAPSRRTSAIGSQEKRLKQAFGGRRVPTYSS